MKKLGFGCMRLPLSDPSDKKSVDFEQLTKMVDVFISNGFSYFDTAYMYHKNTSEIFIRKALVERYPRDCFQIATKLPVSFLEKVEDCDRIFNEQLSKCGVTYFDYYLLHNINRRSLKIANDLNCFQFIQKKKNDNKVRNIGFSYHDDAELLDNILTAHPEIDVVQLQINYLDWDSPNVQSKKCYEVALKHKKRVIAMEPVKGGMLADIPYDAEVTLKRINSEASNASWAIRFVAGLDNVMVVLSGMSNIYQVNDNVDCMLACKPLSQHEVEAIQSVVETINNKIDIPCTACLYCSDVCKKNIPISDYISLYNSYYRQYGSIKVKKFFNERNYYANYIGCGKAGDCISCRKCEIVCPQHIKIADCMKKISYIFDEW